MAVSAKTFDGQYFPIRLEQDGLVSSLLNGTKQNNEKKNTDLDLERTNLRTVRSTAGLPCHIINIYIFNKSGTEAIATYTGKMSHPII